MFKIRLFILLIIIFFIPVQACTDTDRAQERAVFTQIPELKEIKPEKPVKIKLKRNSKGNYSWEISGDNAEKIIETDKKLRGILEKRD
jgi:predicted secreted protein